MSWDSGTPRAWDHPALESRLHRLLGPAASASARDTERLRTWGTFFIDPPSCPHARRGQGRLQAAAPQWSYQDELAVKDASVGHGGEQQGHIPGTTAPNSALVHSNRQLRNSNTTLLDTATLIRRHSHEGDRNIPSGPGPAAAAPLDAAARVPGTAADTAAAAVVDSVPIADQPARIATLESARWRTTSGSLSRSPPKKRMRRETAGGNADAGGGTLDKHAILRATDCNVRGDPGVAMDNDACKTGDDEPSGCIADAAVSSDDASGIDMRATSSENRNNDGDDDDDDDSDDDDDDDDDDDSSVSSGASGLRRMRERIKNCKRQMETRLQTQDCSGRPHLAREPSLPPADKADAICTSGLASTASATGSTVTSANLDQSIIAQPRETQH